MLVIKIKGIIPILEGGIDPEILEAITVIGP
jgi:hypothetical protein